MRKIMFLLSLLFLVAVSNASYSGSPPEFNDQIEIIQPDVGIALEVTTVEAIQVVNYRVVAEVEISPGDLMVQSKNTKRSLQVEESILCNRLEFIGIINNSKLQQLKKGKVVDFSVIRFNDELNNNLLASDSDTNKPLDLLIRGQDNNLN